MQYIKIVFLAWIVLNASSCDSTPKVIEAESTGPQGKNTPIFEDPQHNHDAHAASADMGNEEHKVVVAEKLNTDKYTYLRVKENEEEYWIAITRREVKVGATCYYRGGLMKKNFQSKEFNRVFETVYLVGEFRDENEGGNATGGGIPAGSEALEPPKNVQRAPGALKISDLVANAAKYNGKTVKITGKCVKINPMIMGRNWLHIQDGSGKNLDLTVTTTETVSLGSVVTLEGIWATNKDFGAGYKYDYILEAAVLK